MSGTQKKKKKKISAKTITIIISVLVIFVLVGTFGIINIFIPVKYLTAYMVGREQRDLGKLRVSYLSLGLSDCTVIELPDGKTMVIDGGDGQYETDLNVIRYLNSRSIDKIDYLVCTSVRGEHCGGLAEIVRYKEVGLAYIPYVKNSSVTVSYDKFAEIIYKKKVKTQIIEYGVGVDAREDGYFFAFLSPTEHTSPKSEYVALNGNKPTESEIYDASAVMWLEYGETSFVFSSDAGKTALKKITDDYALYTELNEPYCPIVENGVKLEACDVVTVAGHGSEDCTYAEWYNALKPQTAVISVGKNYGRLPSAAALGDIGNWVQNPHITSKIGTVTVIADEKSYTVI